jgi:hypothetical protein
MAGRVTLATVSGFRTNQRLVVSIVQGAHGRTAIEICEQHHGEGVGWFDQRTMTLDPREWQQLQSILGVAPESAQIAAAAECAPEVIPFTHTPTPPRRSVASGRG